jgi:hypothetical protein
VNPNPSLIVMLTVIRQAGDEVGDHDADHSQGGEKEGEEGEEEVELGPVRGRGRSRGRSSRGIQEGRVHPSSQLDLLPLVLLRSIHILVPEKLPSPPDPGVTGSSSSTDTASRRCRNVVLQNPSTRIRTRLPRPSRRRRGSISRRSRVCAVVDSVARRTGTRRRRGGGSERSGRLVEVRGGGGDDDVDRLIREPSLTSGLTRRGRLGVEEEHLVELLLSTVRGFDQTGVGLEEGRPSFV